MDLNLIPVLNAVLPRPGAEISGIFLDPKTALLLQQSGSGERVMLCPYDPNTGGVYPAGVVARPMDMWVQDVYIGGPKTRTSALFARVIGDWRALPTAIEAFSDQLVATGVKEFDPKDMQAQDYPVIDGAGWRPLGGHTEMSGPSDIRVTVYGVEFEKGRAVSVSGNLGGVVSAEQAHTVEHAIIRSLQEYAMCSPKTLAAAIYMEGRELAASLEAGFRLQRPEVFGVTSSGACGNPLTNLAQFYLAKQTIEALVQGSSLLESVEDARRKTLSRLSEEFELTSDMGMQAMQALRKGMLHDDSPIAQKYCKRILKRFAVSPWH